MLVRVDDMVRDVRIAIDMNKVSEPLLSDGDIDTLSMDEIISSKLLDAVRLVEMEAPIQMLESGHDFGHDCGDQTCQLAFIKEDGKGFIILPDDFMRLISFRMSDWERTVCNAISEHSPVYKLQSSRWKGICGTPEKPICAVVRRSEGKVLEFYSCKNDSATIDQAAYLPYPCIDENRCIDIPRECYRPAVYRAAHLALASIGDQLNAAMLEVSMSLLHVQ